MAYLLRIWQINETGLPVWQTSLEDPHSGKQIGFANLESLFAYLKDLMGKNRLNEAALKDEEG